MVKLDDGRWGFEFWTLFFARSGPIMVGLMILLGVCFLQHSHRPKIARLIAVAITTELLIYFSYIFAVNLVFPRLSNQNLSTTFLRNIDAYRLSAMLNHAGSIVANILRAGIWAIALWSGLRVEADVVTTTE